MAIVFNDWTNGWRAIDDTIEAKQLAQELTRELSENTDHKLYGRRVEFIGRHPSSDDFVAVLIPQVEYAHIHLTWNQERTPNWPYAEILVDEEGLRRFLNEWIS